MKSLLNKFFSRTAAENEGEPDFSLAKSFDEIYKRELWSKKGGGSGGGSELSAIFPTVLMLARFMNKNAISHVVDLSCGAMDWWPTALNLEGDDIRFTGFDISNEVIERNKRRLASFPGMQFSSEDALTCVIPECDLLVCRETINHLPRQDAVTIVERMRSAPADFIALSNNSNVRVNPLDSDRRVKFGSAFKYTEWNLMEHPFNLPNPFEIIPDRNGRTVCIFKNTGKLLRKTSPN